MDARTAINKLLDTMRPVLLIAKIPKHQIRMRSGKHRISTCNKSFDWLHELYLSHEYRSVYGIYKLLPEQTWKNYELFGIEGLREQVLLEAACRKLFKAWRRGRPPLFNKDRRNDNKITIYRRGDFCRE